MMHSFYKFSKQSQPMLSNFIKIANQQKRCNAKCNLDDYEVLKKIFPLDLELAEKVNETSCKDIPVINLIDSDSEEDRKDENLVTVAASPTIAPNLKQESGETTTSDIAFVIQENLENINELTDSDRSRLRNCEESELEQVFQTLSEQLNSEKVHILSISLCKTGSQPMVSHFCRQLLLPRVKKEYNSKNLNAFEEVSIKHPMILKETLLSELTNTLNKSDISFILKYLKQLNGSFQAALLRDFLFLETELRPEYIILIDELLSSQIEYEALSKLVELLNNAAEKHEKDAVFGKLTNHVIEFLGSNLSRLEKPLKHIIAVHKSIWKAKLEKTFKNSFEDTMLFSQSFY